MLSIPMPLAHAFHAPMLKVPFLLANGILTFRASTPPEKPPSARELERAKSIPAVTVRYSMVDKILQVWGTTSKYFICSISFIEAALILWHESSSAFSVYVPRAALPFVELESLRPSPVSLAGCVLGIAGGLLRMRCYRELGRLYTFELSIRDDHKLITTGPYSIVRHPAYLGSFVFQAGNIALLASKGSWFVESGLWGTLWGKAIASSAVGSMLWIALQLFLRVDEEDRVMRKEFGKEWDKWAKKTAYRLIPFVY